MNVTYASILSALRDVVAALFFCYISRSAALNQIDAAKWNNSQPLKFGLVFPRIAFVNHLSYRIPGKQDTAKLLTNSYDQKHACNMSNGRINRFTSLKMAETTASEWRGAQAISKLTESTAKAIFDIEKIKQVLPHRFPFLLVDKVLEFEPGKRAVGIKQVSFNEDQFNGHFPQLAVMPGVLQVEALAQLGGIIALQQPVSDGRGNFFFAGADGVKWKKPVVPGDTLVMEVSLEFWKEKFGIAKMTGKGYVDGIIAVEVKEMTFAMVR